MTLSRLKGKLIKGLEKSAARKRPDFNFGKIGGIGAFLEVNLGMIFSLKTEKGGA